MKQVYGYWISPKNEIIEVPYESHAEIALEIVLKRNPRKFSTYAIMFRLGYVRVVNGQDNDTYVELWGRHKPTKLQKEFIKGASCIEYASRETYSTLYEGLL